MAADEGGEKTEQPTPRRLQEAREAGRIPRSSDLTAAAALLGGVVLLKYLGGRLLAGLLDITRGIGERPDVTGGGLAEWSARVARATLEMVAPFLLAVVLVTVVGTVLQSGLNISTKRLVPQLDKLNPVNGFKRLVSLDGVTRLGLGVAKMVLLAVVAWFSVAVDVNNILAAGTLGPEGAFDLSSALLYRVALRMAVLLLILALLDYAYQRWQWMKNLKMTRQEVRDELKNMEGDPKIRQRRRQMQFQLAMQRIGLDVPKSDVVVTNPSEFAVAIKYDEAVMEAPRVMAKGKDLLALRIRQVAQQHGIPIVQRPPLARALYAAVEVGQEVPPAFYRAVAEVLAYVYQLAGRRVMATA